MEKTNNYLTTQQLAKRHSLCPRVVTLRAKKLGIEKKAYKGRCTYVFNISDELKIVNYQPIINGKPTYEVEVIRIETTYYIYESKLNYYENTRNLQTNRFDAD